MAVSTKWPRARIGEIAQRALTLYVEYRTDIEPRVAAGLYDGLVSDAALFGVRRSAAQRGLDAQISATRTQDEACAAGARLASGVRAALVRAGASKAGQKAFGVGNNLRASSVPSVLAALDSIVDASARFVDDVRKAGILSTDIDKARALRATLASADSAQESKKEQRKTSTADLKVVQARIESAVDAIVSAGLVAFHDEPEIAERFAAIVPGKAGKKAKPDPNEKKG